MNTCITNLSCFKEGRIYAYCESSRGKLSDGVLNAQVHAINLTGQKQWSYFLSWTSYKIKSKVSSTLADETLLMYEAGD